jgi:hypothetical protein
VLVEAGLILGTIFLIWLAVGVCRAHSITVDFVGGTVFAVLVCLLGKALVSGDLNDNRVFFYVLGIALAAYGLARAHPAEQVGTASGREPEPLPDRARAGVSPTPG